MFLRSISFRFLRPVLANRTTYMRCRPVSSGRWLRNTHGRSISPPRQVAADGPRVLDEKFEEENWGWYSADAFYPVQIGETLQSRYQVLGKLGYDAYSTSWLGYDLQYVLWCAYL